MVRQAGEAGGKSALTCYDCTMMTEQQLAAARACAFLKGLSPEGQSVFLAAGRPRQITAGAFLFLQDEPATRFYILLEGKVRLSQLTPEGHQVIVHHALPGEGIGIIVVLSQTLYPVAAEALENCYLLGWDAETTRRLMLQYPRLALNGLELVAGHFVRLQDRYRELATERVERRVARAVLRLVRQVGRKTAEGILIDMPLSRQDLAEMTGATLYTVSRILSQWERDGLIVAGREQVTLCNPHGLVTIAEDLPQPSQPR